MATPQDSRRQAARGSSWQEGTNAHTQRSSSSSDRQRSRSNIPSIESEPARRQSSVSLTPSPARTGMAGTSQQRAESRGATGSYQRSRTDQTGRQGRLPEGERHAGTSRKQSRKGSEHEGRRQGSHHAAAHSTSSRKRKTAQGSHDRAREGSYRQGKGRPAHSSAGVSDRTVKATKHAQDHMRQGGARHASQQKSKHTGRKVALVAMLALLVIAGGALLVFRGFFSQGGTSKTVSVTPGQEVTVTIPDGAGGSTIVQTLMDAGVISDSSAFLKAVQDQNADQKLKSGTYVFVTGSDPENVVKQLIEGPNSDQGKVTIAEGLTLEQTAQQVETSLGISQQDFIDQAKVANYVSDYPFLQSATGETLEGYLYPKTYDISGKEATADTVIRMMLDQYQTEVVDSVDFASGEAAIAERYNGYQVDDYDILIIASIIEREALNDDDRYKISSVFYNRLSTDMALQSDATMGYVTGGEVTADDLQQESPYNTYLNKGLPPTPICTPSIASIKAALAPADTNYYYFWITQDEHIFSETYEEHLAAIENSGSSTSTPEGNSSVASE